MINLEQTSSKFVRVSRPAQAQTSSNSVPISDSTD